MSNFNVLYQRYSTGMAIAQFSSASQKEIPSENDICNQQYLHYSSLTSKFEHSYVMLIRQRFYPTQSRNWKGSLVRFHTTAQRLRNNFISDFLLCASIDYNRYLYQRFDGSLFLLLRIWFARSIVVSEIMPRSLGQGTSPKVVQRGIKTRSW